MRCFYCGSRTRVVYTDHKADGTHRWLRCLECNASLRTLENYYRKSKPGPLPGTTRPGPRARGSSNGASVLTEDDVRRLRTQAATGVTQRNLAQEYGIAPATVSRIVTRKLWSHI